MTVADRLVVTLGLVLIVVGCTLLAGWPAFAISLGLAMVVVGFGGKAL